MANKSSNPFGPMTSLRPVIIDTANNKLEVPKTRTILISEPLYRRFVDHSKRYHNVASYEEILGNLLSNYDEFHKNEHWYNLDR